MIIVVMGVSGCGKTTIGKMLADKLGTPFYDADDYHPTANIDKMKQGIALTDEDRMPWLKLLSKYMLQWNANGDATLACSALKETYRQTMSESRVPIKWIHLTGSIEVIEKRIAARSGHFMPLKLLKSQFKDLEPPSNAIEVDIEQTAEEQVKQILKSLKAT
ncbi:MAG: gluconokinase [Cyclobacteriaceae bacterium]|nr:gluconokinase [Cyclobacteriaceae bacterium HetDA_MAG_MS6]